jgi:hypothetical protein
MPVSLLAAGGGASQIWRDHCAYFSISDAWNARKYAVILKIVCRFLQNTGIWSEDGSRFPLHNAIHGMVRRASQELETIIN